MPPKGPNNSRPKQRIKKNVFSQQKLPNQTNLQDSKDTSVYSSTAQKSREIIQNRFRESSRNSQNGSRSGSKIEPRNNAESINNSINKLPPTKYSAKANAAMTSRALLPKMLQKKKTLTQNQGPFEVDQPVMKSYSILNDSQKNLKDKIEKQE